jgi:hypothetical protein
MTTGHITKPRPYPTHFDPENGGNIFLRNGDIHVQITWCHTPEDYNRYILVYIYIYADTHIYVLSVPDNFSSGRGVIPSLAERGGGAVLAAYVSVYSPSGKHCLRRPGVDTLTATAVGKSPLLLHRIRR